MSRDASTQRHRVRIGPWFIGLGVVVWFVETWWFGWNLTAQSRAEFVWDMIAVGLIGLGFGFEYRFVRRSEYHRMIADLELGQRAVDVVSASVPLLEDAVAHRRENVGKDNFCWDDVAGAGDTLKEARDLLREISIASRKRRCAKSASRGGA